ncbi:hypothetical protein R3P38DRAFT_2793601 [Favolaschia claudopus]|uniref:Uncharacterized protein n=1 Tax=Favolaschia claudopus TaxID=2862362 RepID=A0AAW0ACF8_9AGAR
MLNQIWSGLESPPKELASKQSRTSYAADEKPSVSSGESQRQLRLQNAAKGRDRARISFSGNTNCNHEHAEETSRSGDDEDSEENSQGFTQYKDQQELFSALRDACKSGKSVMFRGYFETPEDALITDKERVQIMILEIWKVTGYRFRYVTHKNTSG